MRVTADKPIKIFKEWYEEAEATEPVNPNAMTLATVDDDGRPSARMVLLKDVDVDGFVFYTNLGSRKAIELNANPHAALCFYWKTLAKQVRVEGVIELVADAEADAYFASRPKLSQLGAWASKHDKQTQLQKSNKKQQQTSTLKHIQNSVGAWLPEHEKRTQTQNTNII